VSAIESAERWALRDRTPVREGVLRAKFVRGDGDATTTKRFDLLLDLPARTAKVGPHTLALSSGEGADAAGWSCDCPARGVGLCLHAALAAAALTREVDAASADDTPDPRFALPMPEVGSALHAMASQHSAALDKEGDSVRVGDATVSLPEPGATGLACDCPMGGMPTCLHRIVVDAWARGVRAARPTGGASGFTPLAAGSSAALEEGGIAGRLGERLPDEDVARFGPVLARVEMLLAELVCYGLQRTSGATLERIHGIVTLARALGIRDGAPRHAGLGRLARTLERLVQIVTEFQSRVVTTTELDVLREIGVLRNIVRAIRANAGNLPLADFAGATQQEYASVPALDIQGLGFEAWVTAAGYAGVTAYVANLRNGQILTRTNALPIEQVGLDRGNAWADTLGSMAAFAGSSLSFAEVARGRFLLSGAQIAPDSGRLSGSSKTQVAKRDSLALDDAKLRRATIVGGADAIRIARRLGFDPLGRPPTSPPVALVPVKALGAPSFERRTQTLHLTLVTPSVTLPCVLGYSDGRAQYIDNVEKMAKMADRPPRFLFCRIRIDGDGFVVEPITAYFEGAKAGKLERHHLTVKELPQ
jgi:hypothetical protein